MGQPDEETTNQGSSRDQEQQDEEKKENEEANEKVGIEAEGKNHPWQAGEY